MGHTQKDLHAANRLETGRPVELRFDGHETAVREAMLQIARVLDAARLPQILIHPAQIVLGEVFNNVVEHAFSEHQHGHVVLRMSLKGTDLICEVCDDGDPMPDGPLPGDRFPEIDPEAPAEWPEGGFGWALVRELTKELRYDRIQAENVLRFRIPPESQ